MHLCGEHGTFSPVAAFSLFFMPDLKFHCVCVRRHTHALDPAYFSSLCSLPGSLCGTSGSILPDAAPGPQDSLLVRGPSSAHTPSYLTAHLS